jgi:uncharacterized protein YjbJ (UPF0337 family)
MATESSKVNPKGAHDKNQGQAQDDPDAIRAEIRATRQDMTETMNAIQERLNPGHIRDQAVGSVRRATIGRVEDAADDAKSMVKGAGNDVFETIKSNPAPAVLAAVGLGWLFVESRNRSGSRAMGRGRRSDRYYPVDERYGRGGYDYGYTYDEYGRRSTYAEQRGAYEGQGVRDRASDVMGQAGDKVQGAAQQASSKVQDVAGQTADAVQDAAYNAKDAAGQVADTAQHVAHQAQYQAQQVGSRFGDMMQDNPLVIGAAALALGAIVGFAFPSTEKENQVLGPARDRVVDQAQDVAQDTAQKVQHVAQRAADAAKDTAKDEAQKQNLTSGSNQ